MAVPVVYAEEYGSPLETWGANGSLEARRVLRCLWEDRYALLMEVGQNGGQDYPHAPGMGCYAYGATIKGTGQNDEFAVAMNKYEHALMTVVYSTVAPQGAGATRFVTEQMSPATDNRRLEIGRMIWADDEGVALDPVQGLLPPEAPSYQHGTINYILTFHFLLAIPPAALLLNVSNDADVPAFLYPIVFAKETLRHLAPIITRTVGLGMLGHYQLEYRWTFRDKTWSKFQDSGGTWRYIYHTRTGAILKPYPPVNFSAMYPP